LRDPPFKFFKEKGNVTINVQRLDNERSAALDTFLAQNTERVEFAPPTNIVARPSARSATPKTTWCLAFAQQILRSPSPLSMNFSNNASSR